MTWQGTASSSHGEAAAAAAAGRSKVLGFCLYGRPCVMDGWAEGCVSLSTKKNTFIFCIVYS